MGATGGSTQDPCLLAATRTVCQLSQSDTGVNVRVWNGGDGDDVPNAPVAEIFHYRKQENGVSVPNSFGQIWLSIFIACPLDIYWGHTLLFS